MPISLPSAPKFRAQLAFIALIVITAFAGTAHVQAQIHEEQIVIAPAPPLSAQFQYATLTATTNTINATFVPVTLANGTVAYENLTIPFSVSQDAKGNIVVTAGTIGVVPSPMTQTNGFIAGNYVGPGGGMAQLLTLSSPGVTSSGATEWSVSVSPGATGCTDPTSATFYVGPLTSNPLYNPRLKNANITLTDYSYGIAGEPPTCGSGSGWFGPGSILGFAQTGNALTIVSFTYETYDQSTPGNQITYTLIPQ
jgi:hypothetical protein